MDSRNNLLAIRLSEQERAMIDQLARVERLPTSTYARRALVLTAEARGILPPLENANRGAVEVEAQRAAVAK